VGGDGDGQAFETLGEKMGSPPVLTVPNMGQLHGRIRIDTDAATTDKEKRGGLGGAVYWQHSDGSWRLVQVYSRVLNKAEANYAAVEAELLAAVETVRAAAWLIRKASAVTLVTDHQAVTHVAKLAEHKHGRLARWAVRLLEFALTLAYRPGEEAVVPDALSRAPYGAEVIGDESWQLTEAGTVREHLLAGDDELAEVEYEPRRRVADVRDQLAELPAGSADLLFVDYPWRHDSDPQARFFRRMDDDEWATLWR